MPFIKVSYNKSTVHLPVKENSVSLQTVRAYFPNVSGLTFIENDKKCGLSLPNDKFELMPGVNEYEGFSCNTSLNENNLTGKKKKRFEEIMDLVEGKDDRDLNQFDNQENRVNTKNITKKLYVGWKHKENPAAAHYEQMKGRVGGIKPIELDGSKEYSYSEIRRLSIEAMKNIYNSNILNNSTIQLANKDDEVIENFTVLNGKKCKFWEFMNIKLKSKNSQMKPYLLSISQTDEEKTKIEFHKTSGSKHYSTSTVSSSTSGNGSKIRFKIRKNVSSSVVSIESKSSTVVTEIRQPAVIPKKIPRLTSQLSISRYKGEEDLKIPTIQAKDIEFTGTVLGQSAFGCVKLAIWNGSEVAVKCLDTKKYMKYVVREVKTLDSIRHPNIISIMSVCTTDECAYIVMEYFKSTTLTNYIAEMSNAKIAYPLKKNRKYLIALQICKAVTYMHGLTPTILHKDLKPDNILVNKDLLVKICDLGLSKMSYLHEALNSTIGNHFHGTPKYMAPEILLHNEPGTTYTDVWAMACCLFELFTERNVWVVLPRFTIPNLRNTVTKYKKPQFQDDVPLNVRAELSKCFEHDPLKRPT